MAQSTEYPKLDKILEKATPESLLKSAVPYLIRVWLTRYWKKTRISDVVETTQDSCFYLFDIQHERLIAAWTVSRGRHLGKRDASRMRGHPLSFGSEYHRGHAIPHSGGGPADINLVPQLGSLNVGKFRVLEKETVATPGSLYFTHWIYDDDGQMPVSVEQGLLRAGIAPQISVHNNQ